MNVSTTILTLLPPRQWNCWLQHLDLALANDNPVHSSHSNRAQWQGMGSQQSQLQPGGDLGADQDDGVLPSNVSGSGQEAAAGVQQVHQQHDHAAAAGYHAQLGPEGVWTDQRGACRRDMGCTIRLGLAACVWLCLLSENAGTSALSPPGLPISRVPPGPLAAPIAVEGCHCRHRPCVVVLGYFDKHYTQSWWAQFRSSTQPCTQPQFPMDTAAQIMTHTEVQQRRTWHLSSHVSQLQRLGKHVPVDQ